MESNVPVLSERRFLRRRAPALPAREMAEGTRTPNVNPLLTPIRRHAGGQGFSRIIPPW